MKNIIKIVALLLGLIMIVTGCESPIDSSGSGSDGLCSYMGEDGQIHHYVCGSNYGGGCNHCGGNNNHEPVRILIHLPDTAKNCAYGIFFIADTLTYDYDYVVHGICSTKTSFAVYTYDVPKGFFYMAILVSKTQQSPINFEPVAGDYLGWYEGEGIYPGIKSVYEYPTIYSVFLSEIQ